jgi:F0F1-type ATP synthase membrane subunit a
MIFYNLLYFSTVCLFLELGVASLQAYVFTVLVCIYLNDAIKGASH